MRVWIAGLGVAGFLLISANVAQGCGDKLVSLLSAVRYQRAYKAWRQASVAVLWNNGASGAVLTNPRLQTALKEVGHKVILVPDLTQLNLAMKSGTVDVVFVDAADAGAVAPALKSTTNGAVLVPVLYKPTKDAFAAARRQYPFALKAPGDEIQFLTAIEAAMKSKAKTGGKS